LTARLRQADRADFAGMHRVRRAVRENRLVSLVLTEADYVAAIEPPGRGWVIESEGEIVAFAVADSLTGNIWALFVDPDHERRGHGRRLLEAMTEWLWSRGLQQLSLTTAPGTRAESFYVAAGWRRAGATPGGELRFERTRDEPTQPD
jgi:GNAT superfamily N-acetyltransferase